MDLWQAFKDSPLWFQIIFVILQVAALHSAVTSLLPAIWKWCLMIIQKIARLIKRIQESCIWERNKPFLSLMVEPSEIEIFKSEYVDYWSSRFKISIQNKDSNVVQVNFRGVQLLLTQGKGQRQLKTTLTTEYESGQIELGPTGTLESSVEQILVVKGQINHPDRISNIKINKPYKWEIKNINGRVHPLLFRSLQTFKGYSK
jgi:hypothetical protein